MNLINLISWKLHIESVWNFMYTKKNPIDIKSTEFSAIFLFNSERNKNFNAFISTTPERKGK